MRGLTGALLLMVALLAVAPYRKAHDQPIPGLAYAAPIEKGVCSPLGSRYTATAYTAKCRGCSGVTATGLQADYRKGIIAVDPKVIKLGSRVRVCTREPDGRLEWQGDYTASDVGGAVRGRHIDILVRSASAAREWGRRDVYVRVIKEGAKK